MKATGFNRLHQSRTLTRRRIWRDRPEAPQGRRRREVPEGAGVVCWGCLMMLFYLGVGIGTIVGVLMRGAGK